jgi:hypothetical protein
MVIPTDIILHSQMIVTIDIATAIYMAGAGLNSGQLLVGKSL